jgi:branched-chain amino acid transport system ATP-binding protein
MAEILRARGLAKRYGGVAASDGVDLDLERGEVHALIGPNGAGKSTLVHLLSGSLAPDAGTVAFEGRDVTRLPMHARVAAGIARSFQATQVFDRLTVLENAALAVQARSGTSFSFWRDVRSEPVLREEARAALDGVGLGARADALAGSLSHGEQRRLEVSLALATRARLLLLDEPLAGLDLRESAELVAMLRELRLAATILLVEHDMDAVFRLADRISVLVDGRVIATGSPQDVRGEQTVRRAYLGDASHA